MKKRMLSLVTVLALLLSIMPIDSYADSNGESNLDIPSKRIIVKLDEETQSEFDSLNDFGFKWMHIAFQESIWGLKYYEMGNDFRINNTHRLKASNIASIDLGKGIKGGAKIVIPMEGNDIYSPIQVDYKTVERGYYIKRKEVEMTLTVSRRPEILSEKTKLVSTGFSEYLAVEFNDGFNLDNVSLTLDGVDISENMTKVTDDGKILKWQLSSLNPAKLVAKDKNTGKEQIVKLSDNKNPAKPVLNADDEAAHAIISHGRVAIWDYHLTNYDEDGNVRVSPAKTTFSLEEEVNEHKFFSPVAELTKANNHYGVKADVEIMFNYSTDEQKAYFDAITNDIALVEFDENLNTLNDDLEFTKERTEHYGHQVGILHIPAPQTNFFANKRYLVRVPSKGYKTQLVPIHLVNEVAPKMILDEQGELVTGKNIHFRVENMVYGATMPVELVTLTDPAGNTRQLEKIRDYYLIGDLFVLYNDVNAKNGRNNIPYKGKYTLNVQSNGFKDMEKSFVVVNGEEIEAENSNRSFKVDVLSRATVSPGGGGTGGNGGGGSTPYMSATLVFNVDLLTNAIILDELKIENKYAKGIVDRFVKDTMADYVYDESGTPFYTYRHWVDAYQDAKMAGNYLSFKDYLDSGSATVTQNKPYAVKEVLEDNLLGQTQYAGTYLGKEAPKFELKDGALTVEEGNDAVLVNTDEYYLALVTEIKVNGKVISVADYKVGDKELVISKTDLQLGKNEVEITATGYKTNTLNFKYEKVLEDVSLNAEGEHFTGEDVVVKVEGTNGDFLNNFKSVKVNGKQLLTQSAGGNSQNDWYVLGTDYLTIKGGNFKTARKYKISIDCEYYETKNIEIVVQEKEEDPEDDNTDKLKHPGEISVEVFSSYFGKYSRLSFEGATEAELGAYLNNLESVTFDGEERTYEDWGIMKPGYKISNNDAFGYPAYIDLQKAVLNSDKETKIKVIVKGYEDLSFTIDKDGNLVTDNNDDTNTLKHPGEISVEVFSSYFGKYSRLSFEGATEAELGAYLKKLESVTFDGEERTYEDWGTMKPGYKISNNDAFGYPAYIDLQKAVLNSDKETKITVIVKGYEDLSFTIDKNGNLIK